MERDAGIVSVLRDGDLVLLSVTGAGDWAPAAVAERRPGGQEDLAVLGYELAVPTMGSKSLRQSFGSSRLRDMIPDAVRVELQKVGFPSVDLEILRLEGHLLPGHSGGPIFDRDGKVVAVANGGLEHGAASISWGIPTAALERLRSSKQSVPQVPVQRVTTLFAASLESAARHDGQTCGSVTFTRMRTRSFADIKRSTDNPIGLEQILQGFAFAGLPDMSSLMFDIHVDRESGGTVVLPAGATLQPLGPVCLTQSRSGSIRMFVRGDTTGNPQDVQIASVNFENFLIGETRLLYQRDPQWSYLAPTQRFDGLVVNRKAAVGFDGGQQARAYLFETLISRGRTFLGVAAVNWALNQAAFQRMQACRFQPQMPDCIQLRTIVLEWAPFALAIHMSTYPIG